MSKTVCIDRFVRFAKIEYSAVSRQYNNITLIGFSADIESH